MLLFVVREQMRRQPMNESLSADLQRLEVLRRAWKKGIDSGSAGALDFAEIKRNVKSRLKRKRAKV